MATLKFSFKRGRKSRKSSRRRVSRKKRAAPVRRTVRREIRRAQETKTRTWANLSAPLAVSSNTLAFDTANVWPIGCQAGAAEILQGVGQGQRVGNRIELVKCQIKGTLVANQYDAQANPNPCPVQIRMVLFYKKETPTVIPTPAQSADILDLNNTAQGFHNDLVDLWAPFNSDKYRILKTWMFKLGFADSRRYADGTQGTLNLANNDFKYNCNFNVDYTKYMIKKQVYADNSVNATSRQLYLMWIPVAANGAAFSPAIVPAGVQWQGIVKYKDA